jgi:formate dehydrogenase major subunit
MQDDSMLNTAFIDGEAFMFESGEMLLGFIDRHRGRGHVPTLCDAPQLKPFGACRLCSVEIAGEIDGPRRVVASCHTPVTSGIHVFTESPRIQRLRRNLIELVLTDHPLDCLTCEVNGNCELQTVAAKVGIRDVRYLTGESHLGRAKDLSHVFMTSDLSKCINCARCVRACDEVQGQFVLSMHGRGFDARIIKGLDVSFADSPCVSCGACAQACPTSAISDVFESKSAEASGKTRSVCTYCGVGCNLIVSAKGDEVLSIEAAEDSMVNPAHACLKGRYAFTFHKHPDRLRSPLLRKDGELEVVSWDEAYDCIVKNISRIRDASGARAIGGIASSRCTNEENYLMQKFMRAVIGCNNIDSCARLCHIPSAFGMQQSFGTGAATNSFEDIDIADCILVIGANPTEAHPVTGARIKQRVIQGVPLIVIDPRRIELAKYAKYHLQARPGTNAALLNLMARFILDAGLVDRDFISRRCEGWADLENGLRRLDIERMAEITGVDRELVKSAAIEYASANAAMCFHGLGVTEHEQGAKSVMLIANLVMMTGNIGRPGTGMNPLRGQNNVQGAADMGCHPWQGPGYLDLQNPESRARLEMTYGVALDGHPGLGLTEMIDAAVDGSLKALWVIGDDLVHTNPNSPHVEQAMRCLDFLVVQDLFMTETARFADVVLPASSFLEKSGTFTNAERRVQRVHAALRPYADSRSDGRILCDIMQRFGYPQADYSVEGLFAEIASAVSPYAGATWDGLGDFGKRWPILSDGEETPILHVEKFKRGLGKFHFFEWVESEEIARHREKYPFILTTGRLLAQYNSGTMTRREENIRLVNEDVLEIHPQDARAEGIATGDRVRVSSARGEILLTAKVTDEVNPGILFTSFHFPELRVNHIIGQGADEETKCPEYKVVAVRIAKMETAQRGEVSEESGALSSS